MKSRFKEIEMYEYSTTEKTSFSIFNLDESNYLWLNDTEIEHVGINTKTGIVVLIGKIFGAEKETKLSKWKSDQVSLIKRLNVEIVRGGRVRQYVLNAGIMKIVEDYTNMTYMAVFQHDKNPIEQNLYHSVELLKHGVIMDIKIDKNKIGVHNVNKSTLANLGLSGLGYGLGVATAVGVGTLSIPATITLAIGGSYFISCTIDFNLEVYGKFEKIGKYDMLQQFTGKIGKLIAKTAGLNKYSQEFESGFEGIYYYLVSLYGAIQSGKALGTILNPKSYTTVTKIFNNGSYIKLNFIKMKDISNFNKVQSAARKFAGGIFINDLTNTATGGKIGYDETEKLKQKLKEKFKARAK